MSNTILYGFSKQDLERTIETVIARLRKTEFISQSNVNVKEDRLTQKEAAELLGVTVQCIINWKKKKLIPFYQIGRSVFFSKDELLKQAKKNPSLIKIKKA